MTERGSGYTDDTAREAILEAGRRLYAKDLLSGNSGNLSCRVGGTAIWTTATGTAKGFLAEADLVKTDLDGRVLAGERLPSSELKLHLRLYRERPDVLAVCHAHPPKATAFAVRGLPLSVPVLPETILQLGRVPVVPYAPAGSQELADHMAPCCREGNGLLLEKHGAVTWGKTLEEARVRMEVLEHTAAVLLYTRILDFGKLR